MKLRRKTKSIISGILLVAIIAGVLALAGSLLGKETKTISSTEFSVGGINDQGNYVESKTSIYTKDMFECQGLTIEPDFEATGTYKVFYYDSNKNFIVSTEDLNAEDGVYNRGNAYITAQYARIMITPDVPVDEDGKEVEDFKIRFYEVTSYASDYTITVNKEQKFSEVNLAVVRKDVKNVCYKNVEGTDLTDDSNLTILEGYSVLELIDVRSYAQIKVISHEDQSSHVFLICDSNGIVTSVQMFNFTMNAEGEYEALITIPSNAVYVTTFASPTESFVIYPASYK